MDFEEKRRFFHELLAQRPLRVIPTLRAHVLNETNVSHYKSEAALVTTQDHMGKNRCPLNIGAK